jgi:flavin-dependent dehydrogenase
MVADVIVIGGGPAGATISRILAENDVDVLLFEKRKVIGVPVRRILWQIQQNTLNLSIQWAIKYALDLKATLSSEINTIRL